MIGSSLSRDGGYAAAGGFLLADGLFAFFMGTGAPGAAGMPPLVALAAASLLALAVVLARLYWVRRRALRALAAMRHQVEDAGNGRFGGVPQPEQAELIPLARALNVMSERLSVLAAAREKRLQELHGQAEHDVLTGTLSRGSFMDRFAEHLSTLERGDIPGAYQSLGLVLLRVADLNGQNQRHGRNQADELIRSVASILQVRAMRWQGGDPLIGRLNGPDFAILLPNAEAKTLEPWAHDLASASGRPFHDGLSDAETSFYVGSTPCAALEGPGPALTRADAALQYCERTGLAFRHEVARAASSTYSIAQWRSIIDEALASGRVLMRESRVCRQSGRVLFRTAYSALRLPDGSAVDADLLTAPAIRAGRTLEIDLRVLELALRRLREAPGELCVHIAVASVLRPGFVSRVRILLGEYAAQSSRLWIAIESLGEIGAKAELLAFAQVVRPFGVRLGIAGIGLHLEALCEAVELAIHFIELAPALCKDLKRSDGRARREALRLMAAAAESNQIAVIAPGVDQPGDADELLACGVSWICTVPAAEDSAEREPEDAGEHHAVAH